MSRYPVLQQLRLQGKSWFPSHQYVSAGYTAEPQVLDSPLLELYVSVTELAVWPQNILDCSLHFWKQVNELDVSREQQSPSWNRAQVELGVEKVELNQWTEREHTTTPIVKHPFKSSLLLKQHYSNVQFKDLRFFKCFQVTDSFLKQFDFLTVKQMENLVSVHA